MVRTSQAPSISDHICLRSLLIKSGHFNYNLIEVMAAEIRINNNLIKL